MAGLAPMNIRQPGPAEEPAADTGGITVEMADAPEDAPITDESGKIVQIRHGDGSVTISLDGSDLNPQAANRPGRGWYDNLADDIAATELSRIADDLLRGIADDIESRRDWIEDRATGMKLLGLKIEVPGLGAGSDGAPVEGMSKVRHPLLLEAVLRFSANARSELLPTDGPVKIRNDSTADSLQHDQMANALEMDLNHYLTATATEYYPDTDRMLLILGFGGTEFKKVYYCPLRARPVSETIDADDLIVNNAATDLRNARRITHRSYMRPSTVKRMQILGYYRDVALSTPNPAQLDSLQREERAQQGITQGSLRPDDRDHEIYECYCELDVAGLEHQHRGAPSGLEIPYCVTIDVSSREVLSITRNYAEDDKKLPTARCPFVKYTFVPGFGFYDIGLLHILGNTTNAITAAWREMLDSGMYANFPGFLMADTGARQNTNIFRVPPGGGALVKTGGAPIREAIMPLPYQTTGMAALMGLVSDMAQTGQRIGGTSEQQVGEGRAEAPVGTTLAMIEQATKVMNAVHKRLHAAQSEEFRLLMEVFKEHPESFWQRGCKSGTSWDEATFLAALNSCDLVPQADPNTASHGQRVMKIMALKQLQAASPSMYDPIAIDTAALQAIGFNNPQQFFAPPQAQAQPPPELQEMQATMKAKLAEADAKTEIARAKTAEVQAKIAQGAFAPKAAGLGEARGPAPPQDTPVDLMQARAKMLDAQTKARLADMKGETTRVEDENRDLDRQSHEQIALLDLAKEVLMKNAEEKARGQDRPKGD